MRTRHQSQRLPYQVLLPALKDAAVTGDAVTVSTTTKPTSFQEDDGNKADIKPGETLKINGDGKNISTVVNETNSIQVKLNDDINVNTVKAGDTLSLPME